MTVSRRPRIKVAFAAALLLGIPFAASAREPVAFSGYPPHTAVIVSHARQHYVVGHDHAIRYPIGIGKAGMTWYGGGYFAHKDRASCLIAPGEHLTAPSPHA